MNIFFLDRDPIKAAQYNCDKHVIKIILETCQMLENKTWRNHPMTKWVNRTQENFEWTAIHSLALCEEYTNRYSKRHSWEDRIRDQVAQSIINKILEKPARREFTSPPLYMPMDCCTDNFVESYRNYYLKYKRHLFKWTRREKPDWIIE